MIWAVVLAAGRSERMGTQKLLLPLGGKPVIARIVDELALSPVQQIIVVVGRDAAEIQAALSGRTVTYVDNPNLASDMFGSLRCGLQAVPTECEAVLVTLGDQPNLTAQLVTKLIAAFKDSGRGITVPSHNGHRGHPVLIAARFRDELLSQHEAGGLRGLLHAHPEEVHRLEIADATLLEDMDAPIDYQAQLTRITSCPSPGPAGQQASRI